MEWLLDIECVFWSCWVDDGFHFWHHNTGMTLEYQDHDDDNDVDIDIDID